MEFLTPSLPKMLSWWCCILLRLVSQTCFSTIPSLPKMLSCWCRILSRLVPGACFLLLFVLFFYNPFTAKDVVLLVPYSSKTSTRDMGVFSTTPSLSKMSCWCCILPRILPETCFSIKAINYFDNHDDNDHDDENDDEDYYYCYMLN